MREDVQHYYSEVLQSSADLRTDACCTIDDTPDFLKAALAEIHDEVLTRYYGCGLVLPDALEGTQILDLGCGAGRDCYILSKLVGESGQVVGVDMTPEQLAVAARHRDYHAKIFGYSSSNVEFVAGDIEALADTNLADARFDLIVSNCVINLAVDKLQVLKDAYRLLKPGGELYFADIYTDRRVPDVLRADPVLYGECLSGALYWSDFDQLARQAGFIDPRLVSDRPVAVSDPKLAAKVGDIQFYSATYRLFKLAELESSSEDYGHTVCYNGLATHQPERFAFDKDNQFETGQIQSVSGNTWRMLNGSRLQPYFDFEGDFDHHYGAFTTSETGLPFDTEAAPSTSSCC
jgi:arsenite methyltransferase